jgi:transcription-repair coupling factor (superfamily II helicase)
LLCLVPGFIDEKKLHVIPITRFLNATINSTLRAAIRKAKYHFKELTTLSVGDYVTHIHGIGFGGLQKYRSKTKRRKL